MGIEGLDELLAAEYEKARDAGFPIQQERTTRQSSMMLEWAIRDIEPVTFVIPDHYTRGRV